MTVLREILSWSQDRPEWQRDALRRLVTSGELTDVDIDELVGLCKGTHGLSDRWASVPLSAEHIPDGTPGAAPVDLVSIFHHRGVNALAESQTLKFGRGLTVVYGDNGAGKTGYIRILKCACRARGQEVILGNVVAGTAPHAPVIAVKYLVGPDADTREWTGGEKDELVSRVSVFDTQCASVYLTEKTDVAFRPFGLDLFDKLVKACKAVRASLEAEQRLLSAGALGPLRAQVVEGTVVGKLLAAITSLTKPEAIRALAHLSPDEEARLALLEKSLADLQANDPQKLAGQLTAFASRVEALATHLKQVEATLSSQSVDEVFDARRRGRRKGEEAKRLREATFSHGLLAGTGADAWSALWQAARHFSEGSAYASQAFPVVFANSRCVLCQQELDAAASQRLVQFEAFVTSQTERELREIREAFARSRRTLLDLVTLPESVEATCKEIGVENEALSTSLAEAISTNESRRQAIIAALVEDKDLSADCPGPAMASERANAFVAQLRSRIASLRAQSSVETKKRLTDEADELRARKRLQVHQQEVLDDIERQKKYAAYGLCIEETRSQSITQKSTALTKTTVSQRLKQRFKEELARLAFRHIEVELKELGGSDGVFYHKLVLTRAPGVELPKVVSEGEQRCLSIAAFFAELSTADNPSGIVFDDPVSSLDFQWRQGVARRLVQESKARQVIVFTHDIVFLLALRQFAEDLDVECLDQHVRHGAHGAGVCTEELPWVALGVKKKIGYLKNEWQKAEKLSRDGHADAYEKEAKYLYGYLREAWERGLEEVLLGGVVERYRPGVQTQQIGQIADITDEDCRAVEAAMTKCSAWLAGHDQAAAARAPVPGPDELKADIKQLEDWVDAIRKRRRA